MNKNSLLLVIIIHLVTQNNVMFNGFSTTKLYIHMYV